MTNTLLYILAEPFTWFAVAILVENVFIFKMYIRWRSGNRLWISALKLLGCFGLGIVALALTLFVFSTFSHFSSRKSKVDVAPLATLNLEKVSDINSAIERLEDYEFISRFQGGGVNSVYTGWSRENPPSSLLISIEYHDEERTAIAEIQNSNGYYDPHIEIINDNGTGARLFNSKMLTTSDTLYFPDTNRYLRSIIRLGNVTFTLTEYTKFYYIDNNLSSEFVKLLCKTIEGEATQELP